MKLSKIIFLLFLVVLGILYFMNEDKFTLNPECIKGGVYYKPELILKGYGVDYTSCDYTQPINTLPVKISLFLYLYSGSGYLWLALLIILPLWFIYNWYFNRDKLKKVLKWLRTL